LQFGLKCDRKWERFNHFEIILGLVRKPGIRSRIRPTNDLALPSDSLTLPVQNFQVNEIVQACLASCQHFVLGYVLQAELQCDVGIRVERGGNATVLDRMPSSLARNGSRELSDQNKGRLL
jgi:hypothetical protein